MKAFALGTIAVVALATGSALAADIPVKAPVYKAPPVVLYNWTGCYVGGNVGGGWMHKNWSFVDGGVRFDEGSHSASGVIAGGQAGCDYQTGPWVIGAEGKFDWTNLKGNNLNALTPIIDDTTKVRWLTTATGRIGYTWDRVLVYAKGGGAWVNDNYKSFFVATGGDTGSAKITVSGWTVGGGVEYAFASNWSAKIEYGYLDFGKHSAFLCNRNGCASVPTDFKQHAHTALLGINYRFGWPGVAKY